MVAVVCVCVCVRVRACVGVGVGVGGIDECGETLYYSKGEKMSGKVLRKTCGRTVGCK